LEATGIGFLDAGLPFLRDIAHPWSPTTQQASRYVSYSIRVNVMPTPPVVSDKQLSDGGRALAQPSRSCHDRAR